MYSQHFYKKNVSEFFYDVIFDLSLSTSMQNNNHFFNKK